MIVESVLGFQELSMFVNDLAPNFETFAQTLMPSEP